MKSNSTFNGITLLQSNLEKVVICLARAVILKLKQRADTYNMATVRASFWSLPPPCIYFIVARGLSGDKVTI
jgi:hypothetical protein